MSRFPAVLAAAAIAIQAMIVPASTTAAVLPKLALIGSDLDGVWQGMFQAGGDAMAVAFTIATVDNRTTIAVDILEQSARDIPVNAASRNGSQLHFDIGAVDGSFDGALSADGMSIDGTWVQAGKRVPLAVKRRIGQNTKPDQPAQQKTPDQPKL